MLDNIKWRCPRCRHHKYISYVIAYFGKPNRKNLPKPNTTEMPSPMRLYVCNKCTVVFTDPFFFNEIIDYNYNAESVMTDCFRKGYEEGLCIDIIRNNIKQKLETLKKEQNELDSNRKEKK